jgi:hypothetical protein
VGLKKKHGWVSSREIENVSRGPTTEYTELQPLLSGVHSVMRVKLGWLMRVGGARPPPLITFTLTSKVAVYAPAELADTLSLFHLYQYVYSVGPTFGDFVTIRTEGSMQDVSVAVIHYRVQEYKLPILPPLLNVMYCVRVSLWAVKIFLAQH